MNIQFIKRMASLLVISLIFPLLAACGQSDLSETYPLESVSRDGNSTSYVYRATDTPVPEVANALAEQNKPKEISKEDTERMFLIYSDEMIQVMQDPEEPEDSLIEVDSLAYVQQNYDRSFLEMYFQYKLLDSLFDSLGGLGKGKYRGYTDRKAYTPSKSYTAPTKDDLSKVPPITVQRKGSVTRRGTNKDTTVENKGNIFERNPSTSTSKGSITRDTSGGGLSTKNPTVKKSKAPKLKKGKGGISRRGRR